MFIDLSKAFGKMNRDLLIAKLEKYDFQKDAPSFMKSYSDLGNYADGNTFYSCGISLEEVKEILRGSFEIVTKWFYENCIFLSSGKLHLWVLRKLENFRNKYWQ